MALYADKQHSMFPALRSYLPCKGTVIGMKIAYVCLSIIAIFDEELQLRSHDHLLDVQFLAQVSQLFYK